MNTCCSTCSSACSCACFNTASYSQNPNFLTTFCDAQADVQLAHRPKAYHAQSLILLHLPALQLDCLILLLQLIYLLLFST